MARKEGKSETTLALEKSASQEIGLGPAPNAGDGWSVMVAPVGLRVSIFSWQW